MLVLSMESYPSKNILSYLCDYTGAFLVSMGRYRGINIRKACLYELVHSLCSDASILAFKRFISVEVIVQHFCTNLIQYN